MDIEYSAPEIHKKDLRSIEKTIGSVKELLLKLVEKDIKLYIENNNIKQYNNERHNEFPSNVEQSIIK